MQRWLRQFANPRIPKGRTPMPMTTDERLDMLQIASRAWLELKRLADSIPDATLEKPNTIGTWSGRDMLGHLAGWEAIGIDLIQQLDEKGEFEKLGLNRETVNPFNEEMLVPYRAMTTTEVRQALEDTHYALMALAEKSQADQVAEVVFDVTRDHYNKHVPDLRGIPT
jgi:hypothetical protein